MKEFLFKKGIVLFLLGLYIISGYIPNFGAVDRVSNQWFFLNALNIISFLYVIYNNSNFIFKYKKILVNPITIIFFTFIIWGLFSYFYAINPNEVIIKFSRWFNVFCGLLLVSILLKAFKNPFKTLAYLMSLGLLVEISTSLFQYFNLLETTFYDFGKAFYIKGLTANKNITSASMVVKLPFLIYLIWNSSKPILKYTYSGILFFAFYNVILLSSRATYISITIMIILITLYFIISGIKHKTLIKNINQYLSYPILAFSCSILFSIIGLGSDNSASITNRISTVNTNDTSTNQRIRYYGHALNQIEHNPIIGAGMGSWKVKSIKYDHLNMEGYTVPYHAHNDFLEIAAELGLIGFLLYFSIFIIIGFYFLKRIIYYKIENKGVVISIILGLSLIGYLIDANLNFPHARVINQINLIFIIAGFLNFKHETI
mgnify:FL=1